MERLNIIGRIGDVNPIDYGGGVLAQDESGTTLEYFHGAELECPGWDEHSDEDNPIVTVYQVPLEQDAAHFLAWHDWINWSEVGQCCDLEVIELCAMSAKRKYVSGYRVRYGNEDATFDLDDPMHRSGLVEAAAGYYGWENFDSYPRRVPIRELVDRWQLS